MGLSMFRVYIKCLCLKQYGIYAVALSPLQSILNENQFGEFLEVWSSQSGNWIPPLGGIPAGTGDIWGREVAVHINSGTAIGATVNDVGKPASTNSVEPWVQESHSWFIVGETNGIEDRDYTSEEGSGSAES